MTAARLWIERPKIAAIDCSDCSKFAYDLEEGSETEGKRILNGDQPIPVGKPPCHDDDTVCPKGKPGKCEFSDSAAEVFWYWRLCVAVDDHPNDPWVMRFRRMLDNLVQEIKARKLEQKIEASKQERRSKMKF